MGSVRHIFANRKYSVRYIYYKLQKFRSLYLLQTAKIEVAGLPPAAGYFLNPGKSVTGRGFLVTHFPRVKSGKN